MSGPLLSLLIVLLAGSCSSFILRSPKIGEMRQQNLNSIIECFERHSQQNKRVFASTQGNVAKLYDENGVEIVCRAEREQEEPKKDHYDQHCFFSPLNCFFTNLRLNKQPRDA